MSEISYSMGRPSYRMAEVGRLESFVPTATNTGRNTLHDLVIHSPDDVSAIQARQEAVEELGEKPELHDTLAKQLQAFAKSEGSLYRFKRGERNSITDYLDAAWAAKSILGLSEAVEQLGDDAPESAYLREQLDALDEFNQSNLGGLLRGPVYYTGQGLKSEDNLGSYEPRLRFRASFSGRLLALAGIGYIPAGDIGMSSDTIFSLATMGFAGGMLYHMPIPMLGDVSIKDSSWNRPTVYDPLRKKMEESDEYDAAIASLGSLDVAVALNGIRRAISENGHSTVLPQIEDSDAFHFRATGLRNPMLALDQDREVVPNDLEFGGDDNRLTFITGPNSGGKSTLSKAVIQNLVLGQIGGPMAAESASITPADRIAYHVPMPPNLDAETGRLGFELGRVRKILDNATPRSLTVLDDCLDGTTHEERVQILKNVMLGFQHLGGATLFSTHAHELVGDFESRDEGQFLQVEFRDDAPTYRLVSGVSHTSHAANVAKEHGFTDEQIRAEIESQGISI